MAYLRPEVLVEPTWLAQQIEEGDVAVVDASFHLPTAKRDPNIEFKASHIPGAVFFDINDIADKSVDLPHMLPGPELFNEKVGKLGISRNNHVICYDTNGGAMAAMRAFWSFKVFGHEKVSVLNGGLTRWMVQGYEVESGQPLIKPKIYKANEFNKKLVRTLEQVFKNIDSETEQFVDVRSLGRYNATEPEPRAGLRGGHLPGSINLPFQEMLQIDNHMALKKAKDLETVISNAGIDPSKPVISSCGSGVTAAVLYFSLHLLGIDAAAIYDGSWTEWGSRKDTPVVQ